MKTLFANISNKSPWGLACKELGVLTLSQDYESDIQFDFWKDDLNKIIAENNIEVLIWWGAEYYPLPDNFEKLNTFTITIAGDWNLGFLSLKNTLKRFDLIAMDKFGIENFAKFGYENLFYFRWNGFNPDRFKILPNVEKIYDIVFIGTINNDIHRNREQYIYRMAKLSNKFKVKIATAIYGDDYIKTLNQAKIVFNFGIRKESNMRIFESAACGSLPFVEEDNLEIRDFFEDKKHCVLYNENNFEELIEYYINNDAEREAIISNAHEKAQQETYQEHLKWLLDKIPTLKKETNKRSFETLLEWEKYYSKAISILHTSRDNAQIYNSAENYIIKASQANPNQAEIWNTYALIIANKALSFNLSEKKILLRKAIKIVNKAIILAPNAVVAYFNLANLCLEINQTEAGKEKFMKVIELCETKKEGLFECVYTVMPLEYTLFRVEWENTSAKFSTAPEKIAEAYSKLLLWKTYEKLADIFYFEEKLELATGYYKKAILARPDLAGKANYKLAKLLVSVLSIDEIRSFYIQAIEIEPLNLHYRLDFIEFLYNNKNSELCIKAIQELLLVGSNCTMYNTQSWGLKESLILSNTLSEETITNLNKMITESKY